MDRVELSYIVSTYNKLSYLKETLGVLILNKKNREEIVVADGASTDGTYEYLSELLKEGKIDQLISEKDAGEAHGFNKAMTTSKGELIKIITDDDAFYYPHIKKCKEFMLEHPEINFLSTNGAKKSPDSNATLGHLIYTENYKRFLEKNIPFSFCGLGIMLRKNSLPLLGFFNTNFIAIDAEYSYRITQSKAKIAWFTGHVFVNISNPQSNSLTKRKEIYREMKGLEKFYLGKTERFSYYARLKSILRVLKNRFIAGNIGSEKPVEWKTLFNISNDWLLKNSSYNSSEFLVN